MILTKAADLYKKLQENGFDPRATHGRDNTLYLKLKDKLHCCQGMGLHRFLIEKDLPADKFLEAFFVIAEPFSLMYQDIYREMKKYGASSGSECLEIRLVSDDINFNIDLSDFESWRTTHLKIKQRIQKRLWSEQQFIQLTDFLGMLGGYYRGDYLIDRSKPLEVTIPPAFVDPKLSDALNTIHDLLQNSSNLLWDVHGRVEDDHIGALNPGVKIHNTHADSGRFYDIFISVLIRYENLLTSISSKTWPREHLTEALNLFDEILRNVKMQQQSEVEAEIELLDRILKLPFWKYRWYVYEIWVTLSVAAPLSEFGFKPSLAGNMLCLRRGQPSELGRFSDVRGREFLLVTQVLSTVRDTNLKKIGTSICPDLRIASEPVHDPERTVAIVECKQRRVMSTQTLKNNTDAYEKGARKSRVNVFVNYDQFPAVAVSETTQLISCCHPKNPQSVGELQEIIRKALTAEGIEPSRTGFDAILLDVSGSMVHQYCDDSIQSLLLAFLAENPGCRVFYFNDDLIDPANQNICSAAEAIRCSIGGGTSLERALESLCRCVPGVSRIVVLTDGDYGPVHDQLLKYLEVEECLPGEMKTNSRLWRQ